MRPDEPVEIVDLCDSDTEPTAASTRRPAPEPSPFVRLGTLTTRVSISTGDLDRLSSQLSIRRDPLSTEFQLAVHSSTNDDLPIGFLNRDTAQLFERAVTGDYMQLFGEISQNAFKRLRSDTGAHTVPLIVVITVRPAFITPVVRLLRQSGAPFICEPAIHAMIQAQAAARPAQPVPALRAPSSSSLSTVTIQTTPDLWKLFDSALNAIPIACRAVEPDPCVQTPIYDYQKVGLGWMIQREHDHANNEFQHVFWNRFTNQDGAVVYHNFFTQETSAVLPTGFKGGILADEMGLGKTLQVISLVVSNSRSDAESGGAICSAGPTLIVCPVSVVGNWVDQFQKHVRASAQLRISVYHGNERFKQQLGDTDVVITTYGTLATDYKPINDNPDEKRNVPVFAMKWLRIVLDEAHIIRSQRSLQHAAVIAIDADRRWCLSGTPIQNHLDDFYSLLKFLRAEPLDDYRTWNGAVVTPFKSGSSQGTERVQAIFRAVCLRRTKSSEETDVTLPPKKVFIVKVTLSDLEKRLYHILVEYGRSRVSEMVKAGKLLGGYAGVLECLLRMRMCCNHPNLVPSHFFDSSLIPDQPQRSAIQILSEVLQESTDEDCCFCLQPLTNPCITKCAHLFCRKCISSFVASHHVCPVCSSPLDENSIMKPMKKSSAKTRNNPDVPSTPYLDSSFVSSKVRALLDQLKGFRKEDPSIKSVIFSQWVGMLSIIESVLTDEGFTLRRLDGAMSRQQRQAAIDSFQNNPEVNIFIISLQAGNVGLTLTAASRVFIMDLWYNPGLEQQAIDRVHRVGQQRPVSVYRFIADDTVEEKVLNLQEKKKHIMEQTLASGQQSSANKPKNVLEEINYLFS